MKIAEFKELLPDSCFVFRGYNLTNLGRSSELLASRVYGRSVRAALKEAGAAASETAGRKIDLVHRVQQHEETYLETFADAVALIVAMEYVQIQLLDEFFGIAYKDARMAAGYSLGEVAALVCSGVLEMAEALRVPVAMADDCAELGRDTTMGILFSRGAALSLDTIERLCVEISCEGKGLIAISSLLSPNTVLLLGQYDTVDRFKQLMTDRLPKDAHLRKNKSHWPPLHTPIMWVRNIPNRAALLMHTMHGGFVKPRPPILSLVTGKASYNEFNARSILNRWTDHPQRVWDVVYETLGAGIEVVIHVGPEPNLFPATYRRLSENVQVQLAGTSPSSFGLRFVSGFVRRPWLTAMLPTRAALLRAPFLQHVILEDWLLDQKPD